MPAGDLTFQGDLLLRILVAAVLGAAIGIEREMHDHPAGTRTHLLVALGSALFTVLSAHGLRRRPGHTPPPAPGSTGPAAVTGVIVVVSLGPRNRLVSALRPRAPRSMQMRLELTELDALGRISALFSQLPLQMTA